MTHLFPGKRKKTCETLETHHGEDHGTPSRAGVVDVEHNFALTGSNDLTWGIGDVPTALWQLGKRATADFLLQNYCYPHYYLIILSPKH